MSAVGLMLDRVIELVQVADMVSPDTKEDLRLYRLAAGSKLQVHRHGGCELTLVLDGAVMDETGRVVLSSI